MGKKRIVGIKDIALEAGVSIATVSMVVNGKDAGKVSAETKEKILGIVERLDYRPNLNARSLKIGASSSIGLIIPDVTNHFYPELVKGIMDRANQLGYNVILFDSDNDFEKEKRHIDTLRSIRVRGIIIAGVYDTEGEEGRLFQNLVKENISIVQVDRYDPSLPIPYVGLDNYRASCEMTNYMLDLNHERIALVMPHKKLHIIDERERGFRDTMESRGINVSDQMIFHMDAIHFSDIDQCMQNIIESPMRFTAIYNANGDMAVIESIRALKQYDLSIPEDIGITGFDDIYVSSMLKPALTTIRQPKFELGTEAMNVLEKEMKGEKQAPPSVILNGKLIARSSIKAI